MKRLLRSRNIVIVTALVLLLWLPFAWISGQAIVHIDVAMGKYKLLHYGLGPFDARGEVLHETYGIEYQRVGDCMVSFFLTAYVDGYNRVSMAAAKRKFGHDVFKECEEEGLRRLTDWRSYAR